MGRSRDIWGVGVSVRREGRGEGGTYGQPDGDVGVGGGAGAAGVLLVAEGLDHDWVIEGTFFRVLASFRPASIKCLSRTSRSVTMPALRSCMYQRGVHTSTASIQRLHIKDIDAVHLAQDLESLQTSALLEVGRDGARRSSGWEEVRVILNLYCSISSAPTSVLTAGRITQSPPGGTYRKSP